MKSTKLTIDLGNTQLTDDQKQNLLATIHKAVNASKAVNTNMKPAAASAKAAAPMATGTSTKTVKLHVDFLNTYPGLSELNAKMNGQVQTITQSGDITFTNAATPRILTVTGKSLGTANISFNVPATPATKSFKPGTFIFNFTIL